MAHCLQARPSHGVLSTSLGCAVNYLASHHMMPNEVICSVQLFSYKALLAMYYMACCLAAAKAATEGILAAQDEAVRLADTRLVPPAMQKELLHFVSRQLRQSCTILVA